MGWQWNEWLATGIDAIDKQYQGLFDTIDQLELAIYRWNSAPEPVKLMKYLETYISEHFELEEKLMPDNLYPDFAAHARQHTEFMTIFTRILNDFNSKGADSYLGIDIDKQMRKWRENHILKIDMAYLPYLKM